MLKKILIAVLLIAVAAFGVGFYLFNKGPINVAAAHAEEVNASDLYKAFSTDSTTALKKYAGNVLLVPGTVSSVSVNQQKQQIIFLQTNVGGGFINCTIEKNAIAVTPENHVRIKGICSGIGEGDADMGISGDVYLTRCIIVN